MSKYTTELRYIVEMGYDIGLNNYPIFDESYRNVLNSKIINHFYFREIGYETVALFTNRLNEKMNLIMPYYNQLYGTTQIKFDPLHNFDYEEVVNNKVDGWNNRKFEEHGNNDQSTTTQSESEGLSQATSDIDTSQHDTEATLINRSGNKNGRTISSDTPQVIISMDEVLENFYASNLSVSGESSGERDQTDRTSDSDGKTHGNNVAKSTGTDKGTVQLTGEDWRTTDDATTHGEAGETIRKISGREGGDPSELLMNYRETLLNIDSLIINELESLFMQIW